VLVRRPELAEPERTRPDWIVRYGRQLAPLLTTFGMGFAVHAHDWAYAMIFAGLTVAAIVLSAEKTE
jgi:hypothetical protein